MKLTKTMRETFVDDVLTGIPVKHHFDRNDAMSEIVNAIESKLPEDLLNMRKKYPNIIKREKCIKIEALNYLTIEGYRRVPSIWVIDHPSCELIDVTPWSILKEASDRERIDRKNLRIRLLEISNSCGTLVKLKVALPELESYMPIETVKRNLPVASGAVITDLLASGLKIPK